MVIGQTDELVVNKELDGMRNYRGLVQCIHLAAAGRD